MSGICEQNLPSGAAEQGRAGELFELANLLRNGPGGDVQLLGRAGEGEVARSCLESPKGVEGWEAVFLGHLLQVFSRLEAGKAG